MARDEICRAFCESLSVREIANGLAIGTSYEDVTGEPLGFYAIRQIDGSFRLMDSGLTIPFLESSGVSFDTENRREALAEILRQHRAHWDEDRGELAMSVSNEGELPRAALDFMALLLRVKDLLFLTQERTASTFREDVVRMLKDKIGERAKIRENEPVHGDLSEIIPDMVLQSGSRNPVAFFIATSPTKVHEAIELQMQARYEVQRPLKVVAIIEEESSVPIKLRLRADNRLDALPRFRSSEVDAIDRVVREVLGSTAVIGTRTAH
jgi:hypothetical protein